MGVVGRSSMGSSKHRKSGHSPRHPRYKAQKVRESNHEIELQEKRRKALSLTFDSIEDLFKNRR